MKQKTVITIEYFTGIYLLISKQHNGLEKVILNTNDDLIMTIKTRDWELQTFTVPHRAFNIFSEKNGVLFFYSSTYHDCKCLND